MPHRLLPYLAMCLAIGVSFLVWTQSQRGALQQAAQRNAALVETVIRLEKAIGYGGLIHAFKNAVLRPDEPAYLAAARADHAAALAQIDALDRQAEAAGLALTTAPLRDTVDAYGANIDVVARLASAGRTAEEIDAVVRIDDGPALSAQRDILAGFLDQVTQAQVELDRRLAQLNAATILSLLLITGLAVGLVSRALHRVRLTRQTARFRLDLVSAQAEAERLKAAEMRHRLSNLIGIINAFNFQSIPTSRDPADHAERIAQRLDALSVAHEALFVQGDLAPRLTDIIHRLAAPYVPPVGGATLELTGGVSEDMTEEATTSMCLLLHELITNAAKYGAFSEGRGKVDVQILDRDDRTRRLIWTESGGPRVAHPTREGFGTRLIRGVVEQQLKGRARFDFVPSGLKVEIDLPGSVFVAA